jgi:hypothetical protein
VNARPGAGVLLAAVCLAAAPRTAVAKVRFFPLPMYTTVPNEGSTYGVMPVFMVPADDDPDRVKSITAPSLSWNSSAGVTATGRYYRYFEPLRSTHLLLSASTNINRSLWYTYDDDRRTPGQLTVNILVRVRRNLFYRYFGLGPDTTAAGESSYTRLYAIASARRQARAAHHQGSARDAGRVPGRARARRRGVHPRRAGPALRYARAARLLAVGLRR